MSMFSSSKPSTPSSSPFESFRGSRDGYEDFYSDGSRDDSFGHSHYSLEENNEVQRVINKQAYCFDVASFAEKLVDATVIEAQKLIFKEPAVYSILDVIQSVIEILIERAVNYDLQDVKPSFLMSGKPAPYYLKSISSSSFWPKVSEFTIKLGQEQISLFVQTWKRSSDWLYCIEFLGFESEDCSNVFVYEVEWSKPTKSYPIPQVTASVYFALEVYKMIPYGYDRSVDVSYVFEYSFLVHKPGKINFQEKWLQDIIDEKLKLFKRMVFSVSTSIQYATFISFSCVSVLQA